MEILENDSPGNSNVPQFMAGVPNVTAVLDRDEEMRIQKKVAQIMKWDR